MTRFLLFRQTELDTTAPYWHGERAEAIVAARVASYPPRKMRGSGGSQRKPRSASAEIRRLERALARRKTAAAQQRIRQQIDTLRRGLA